MWLFCCLFGFICYKKLRPARRGTGTGRRGRRGVARTRQESSKPVDSPLELWRRSCAGHRSAWSRQFLLVSSRPVTHARALRCRRGAAKTIWTTPIHGGSKVGGRSTGHRRGVVTGRGGSWESSPDPSCPLAGVVETRGGGRRGPVATPPATPAPTSRGERRLPRRSLQLLDTGSTRTSYKPDGSRRGASTRAGSLDRFSRPRHCALASNATSVDAALRRQDVLRVSRGAGTTTARRS